MLQKRCTDRLRLNFFSLSSKEPDRFTESEMAQMQLHNRRRMKFRCNAGKRKEKEKRGRRASRRLLHFHPSELVKNHVKARNSLVQLQPPYMDEVAGVLLAQLHGDVIEDLRRDTVFGGM